METKNTVYFQIKRVVWVILILLFFVGKPMPENIFPKEKAYTFRFIPMFIRVLSFML